jgi:hypothetical protein
MYLMGQAAPPPPPPDAHLPAHHTSCDDWTYETHPDRAALTERCARLEQAFLRRTALFARFAHDTRPGHRFLFSPMVPARCACIAGTYRGDPSCPWINLLVSTNDRRVGSPPQAVAEHVRKFEEQCETLMRVHRRFLAERQPRPQVALLKYVDVLANVLEKFLTIHPYKDGNGHTGRMLIWLLMVRAGYPPKSWSVDAKQPYGDALSAHRDEKRGALQTFLLQAINGAPAVTKAVPPPQAVAKSE